MMDNGIDLIRYGALWQKVENYEAKFQEMSDKIDKLETSIDSLVAMANRSRGALWLGLGIVSSASTIVGFIAHWLSNK
jgi:predicted HTH transcriptional regulator